MADRDGTDRKWEDQSATTERPGLIRRLLGLPAACPACLHPAGPQHHCGWRNWAEPPRGRQ